MRTHIVASGGVSFFFFGTLTFINAVMYTKDLKVNKATFTLSKFGMLSSIDSKDVIAATFPFHTHTANEIRENAIINVRKGVTSFYFSSCFYDYSDYYAINFVSQFYFFSVILSFSTRAGKKLRFLEGKHCYKEDVQNIEVVMCK